MRQRSSLRRLRIATQAPRWISASVRRPGSSTTIQHEPLPTVWRMRLNAATRNGCTETRLHAGGDERRGQPLDQRAVHRAGEARAERRGLGDLDVPVGGGGAVQRAEAVARERQPLLRGLDRGVPRQQRVAHELVGEHHARLAARGAP